MNNLFKILPLGMLLAVSLFAVPPASATHYTVCDPLVYSPLNGDPIISECDDYSGTYYSCYQRREYIDGPVNVYYRTYHRCNGESWYCYSLLYVDTSPARVGTC